MSAWAQPVLPSAPPEPPVEPPAAPPLPAPPALLALPPTPPMAAFMPAPPDSELPPAPPLSVPPLSLPEAALPAAPWLGFVSVSPPPALQATSPLQVNKRSDVQARAGAVGMAAPASVTDLEPVSAEASRRGQAARR